MDAQTNDQFGSDIDVVVSKKVLTDVIGLADVYGFGYLLLQRTHDTYNICIQYDKNFEQQIMAFIEDVNEIKRLII